MKKVYRFTTPEAAVRAEGRAFAARSIVLCARPRWPRAPLRVWHRPGVRPRSPWPAAPTAGSRTGSGVPGPTAGPSSCSSLSPCCADGSWGSARWTGTVNCGACAGDEPMSIGRDGTGSIAMVRLTTGEQYLGTFSGDVMNGIGTDPGGPTFRWYATP